MGLGRLRVSVCLSVWVAVCRLSGGGNDGEGGGFSCEAGVPEILRSRSGRRGWGREPRCAARCSVDLYLMAERKGALLFFTPTLLLFWCVM